MEEEEGAADRLDGINSFFFFNPRRVKCFKVRHDRVFGNVTRFQTESRPDECYLIKRTISYLLMQMHSEGN